MPPAKAAIQAAARRLFAERGFARTTVRDIALETAADPALVIRYFGSKQGLFLETMQVDLPAQLGDLRGPVDGLGERWVRSLLQTDDDVRSVYLALLRASDTGDVHSQLHAAREKFRLGAGQLS